MKALFRILFALIAMFVFFQLQSIAQPIGTAIIHDRLSLTDSTILNQRMRLNGITATCDSPKVCPGHFGNTGVHYRSYYYTNESSNDECINVMFKAECASQIFCAAYVGSFDPANVSLNYLADPGLSIANGGYDSISFSVPPDIQYCIVVSGINSGDTCENYTLSISQYATSWHGSIGVTDSTQTQRLHLDGVRYTCNTIKQLCVNPPDPGLVYHDGYLYKNTTPNDICIRVSLYQHCTDTASTLTSAAYLNSYDSSDVCYNLAADPGVLVGNNDSLWYSFMVPSGSKYFVIVYSQKDTLFCDDYILKSEADFTIGFSEATVPATFFHLYPNPVSQGDNIIIDCDDASNAVAEIYDVTARKIFTKNFSNDRKQLIIPTSTLSKGVYLLNVAGIKKTIFQKFIVE